MAQLVEGETEGRRQRLRELEKNFAKLEQVRGEKILHKLGEMKH